jgi:hypothetical protein
VGLGLSSSVEAEWQQEYAERGWKGSYPDVTDFFFHDEKLDRAQNEGMHEGLLSMSGDRDQL